MLRSVNCLSSQCKTGFSFSATAAFRRLISHAVVAVSCLLVCFMLDHVHFLCCYCTLLPSTVRTATICCYHKKQLSNAIISVLTVATCTPNCADCCNLHPKLYLRTATTRHKYSANCSNSTQIRRTLRTADILKQLFHLLFDCSGERKASGYR